MKKILFLTLLCIGLQSNAQQHQLNIFQSLIKSMDRFDKWEKKENKCCPNFLLSPAQISLIGMGSSLFLIGPYFHYIDPNNFGLGTVLALMSMGSLPTGLVLYLGYNGRKKLYQKSHSIPFTTFAHAIHQLSPATKKKYDLTKHATLFTRCMKEYKQLEITKKCIGNGYFKRALRKQYRYLPGDVINIILENVQKHCQFKQQELAIIISEDKLEPIRQECRIIKHDLHDNCPFIEPLGNV